MGSTMSSWAGDPSFAPVRDEAAPLRSARMRDRIRAGVRKLRGRAQPGRTALYWEERYRTGGTSGAGSYGALADFKAEVLNDFVEREKIDSVVEFGCGDGNQLSLARYPRYLGLDVSSTAIDLCRSRFAADGSKSFQRYDRRHRSRLRRGSADLAISLDVIYHLIDDDVFERYLDDLFRVARRFVIIYSSDAELPDPAGHVRHRQFTPWVSRRQPQWELAATIPNPYAGADPSAVADFHVYRRVAEPRGRPGS